MTLVKKSIGRVSQSFGNWSASFINPKTKLAGYGKKFRASLYGCEFESLMENNTYAPMTWDGAETFTEDTVHWRRIIGSPEAWIAGQDKLYVPENFSGMGRVVLKKNMVNGINTLTQDMFYKEGDEDTRVPNTNTIFVIKYDFTLGENITIPANCVLEFDGGSVGGNYALIGTIKNDTIYQSWFSDMNCFVKSVNNLRGFNTIEFSEGEHILSNEIVLQGFKNITIHGNGAILKTATSAIRVNSVNTADLREYLNIIRDNAITQALAPGDYIVHCDRTTGIKPGMIACIKDFSNGSYNPSRNYYTQGEFAIVKRVIDSTTIELVEKIVGTYSTIGSLRLVVVPYFTECNIDNLTIECTDTVSSNTYGIKLIASTANVYNVTSVGFHNFNIEVIANLNSIINNCRVISRQNNSGEVSTDCYGIGIDSSQNVTVNNCTSSADHHGIVVGNSSFELNIVNRYIYINNCYGDNADNTFGGGIETHGATEYMYITDCRTNSFELAGDHIVVKNSIIDGRDNTYTMKCTDFLYGNLTIENCKFYVKGWNMNYCIKRDKRSKVIIKDNEFYFDEALNSDTLFAFENADYIFDGNTFVNTQEDSILLILNREQNVYQSNVIFKNNTIKNLKIASYSYSNDVKVCGNTFYISDSFGITINSKGLVEFKDNYVLISGTPNYPVYIQAEGKRRFICNNTLEWLDEQAEKKWTIYHPKDVSDGIILTNNTVNGSANIGLLLVDNPNILYLGENFSIGYDATLSEFISAPTIKRAITT